MDVEPRLVYVVSRWGEPTQTFVRREAEAVAALGVRVAVVSMKRPRPCRSDLPVTWLGPPDLVKGFLSSCLRRPRAVAWVLWVVARRAALRNRAPLIAAAAIGVAWAGAGVVRDARMHVHFGWVSAAAAWACSSLEDDSYSVVLHAFELHAVSQQDQFTPVPLAAAARVFTISQVDADLVGRRWGIDADVLRMGVPGDWLLDARGDLVDSWLVVSVGSLTPKKGHDVLLCALARSDPRWRLVVIGGGPERERLEKLAFALGLSNRIRFAGVRSEDEVRELLDRAAVFALACRVAPDGDRDGIPVALIEAMARRVPVVTTEVSAISELVGGVGILVPPEDAASLAGALDALADSARREEVGGAGRDRVAFGFVVEQSARRVAALAAEAGGD